MSIDHTSTPHLQSQSSLARENIKTAFSYPWEKIKQKDVSIGKKIGFGILEVVEILGVGVTLGVAVGFAIGNSDDFDSNLIQINRDIAEIKQYVKTNK